MDPGCMGTASFLPNDEVHDLAAQQRHGDQNFHKQTQFFGGILKGKVVIPPIFPNVPQSLQFQKKNLQ